MDRKNLLLCLFGLSAVCFISNAEARLSSEGIVGGDDADEGDYPYQVSIEIQGQSICGGTIIGDQHVVTAAHCVVDEDGSFMGYPLTVKAGTSDLNKRASTQVSVAVERVYTTKEYDPTDLYGRPTGDIAVLKLKKSLGISSNKNLGKANLPEKSETYAGKVAVISGFGLNSIDVVNGPYGIPQETNGFGYDKLRYAKAKVFTNTVCQRHYRRGEIASSHICAALVQRDPKQPEGVCSGDSGGPLVYEGALIGVVSTSPLGCREDEDPAVYTRVSSYIDFINNALKGKVTKDMRTTTLRTGGSIWG